jgi:hypothetical protein
VDHQRLAARNAHQRARERGEAAEAQHDVGHAAADDPERRPARGEQCVRPEQHLLHALAAHAGEGHALELDAVPRHQRSLHAVARAEPEHARASRDELRRDGEPREHVPAGSARGDHHRARHTANPRKSRRFS